MCKMEQAGRNCENALSADTHSVPIVDGHGQRSRIYSRHLVQTNICNRHGPVTDCPIPVTQGFLSEYMSLPPDSAERLLLERRYGKSSLQKLVSKFEEEKALQQWLEKSAIACPGCGVHVEKSHGCNHVCPMIFIYILC